MISVIADEMSDVAILSPHTAEDAVNRTASPRNLSAHDADKMRLADNHIASHMKITILHGKVILRYDDACQRRCIIVGQMRISKAPSNMTPRLHEIEIAMQIYGEFPAARHEICVTAKFIPDMAFDVKFAGVSPGLSKPSDIYHAIKIAKRYISMATANEISVAKITAGIIEIHLHRITDALKPLGA